MANFTDSNSFVTHDDYYTRKKDWEAIVPFIPSNKKVWEFCLLNSNEQSKKNLQELGLNVIGNNTIDFLEDNLELENEADILISNIPFSTELKKNVLKKLIKLDKPFIIIMNSLNMFSKYFKDILGHTDIKLITPSYKIHYDKYINGVLQPPKNITSFYSVYITYKVLDKNEYI
tara:strand:- start:2589 stop:3110 length:522 start_codon:yes stop_codon:yes gene_type:complete